MSCHCRQNASKSSTALTRCVNYFTSTEVEGANLCDCSKDVAKLLQSAGLAVKALTKTRQSENAGAALPDSLESHKAAFTSAASLYFTLLSSIDVRLRRQIYALEEAQIIAVDPPAKESSAAPVAHGIFGEATATTALSQAASQRVSKNASTTASSLGNLDVGWLNSRNDKVGKQMEAELWARASNLVQKLESRKTREDTVEEREPEPSNHNSDNGDDLLG
jgi:hypothetical protein